MSTFRPYEPDQPLLLPPSLREWLPRDHLVWFISETVDELDLSPRQVEENIAFGLLAAGNMPDHRTICRFREQHLKAFEPLFVQVVQIACDAGLVKMGTLAVDGSKIRANASKRKAMSYERMQQEEKRLRKEIRALTDRAAKRDAVEDVEFGPDFRGDELPEELRRREKDQENFTDPESRIMKDGSGAFQQCYNAQAAVDGQQRIIVSASGSSVFEGCGRSAASSTWSAWR